MGSDGFQLVFMSWELGDPHSLVKQTANLFRVFSSGTATTMEMHSF